MHDIPSSTISYISKVPIHAISSYIDTPSVSNKAKKRNIHHSEDYQTNIKIPIKRMKISYENSEREQFENYQHNSDRHNSPMHIPLINKTIVNFEENDKCDVEKYLDTG